MVLQKKCVSFDTHDKRPGLLIVKIKGCLKYYFVWLLLVAFVVQPSAADRIRQKGSIITGSCMFGTAWLICFAVAPNEPVAIPVVGPFMQIAKEKPVEAGVLVYSGIGLAQAIGITLLTTGLVGKPTDHSVVVIPYIIPDLYGCHFTTNF